MYTTCQHFHEIALLHIEIVFFVANNFYFSAKITLFSLSLLSVLLI